MATTTKKVEEIPASNTITIDLQPFVTPAAILIGFMIVSIVNLIGFNMVKNAIKGGVVTTGTDTSTDSGTPAAQEGGTVDINSIKALLDDKNLVFGNKNAKNIFVEFSDPSCPYCHIAGGKNGELNKQAGDRFILKEDGGTYVAPVPEMKKLVDDGDAAYVWLYTNGHGNGVVATQAFYCADEKGKFWEVHDKIMTSGGYDIVNNQVANDTEKAGVLADFLGGIIDKSFLVDCIKSGKYADRITSDQALARSLGVSGTPGFFVNATKFAGAYSFDDMKSALK